MLIANPIYDIVFKFLIEDTEAAKHLIGSIIGEEIVSLEPRAQEQSTNSNKFLLSILRMDFKAVIRLKDGAHKKVLIELQKAKHSFDILRFRRYLGENYNQEDEVDGKKMLLPMIAIYFLGFKLHVNTAILHANPQWFDAVNGQPVQGEEEFVSLLTHESYFIQIPRLPEKRQHSIEKILSIFDQHRIEDGTNGWGLWFDESKEMDKEVEPIVKRLRLAYADDDIKKKIRLEEEFERSFETVIREGEVKLAQKDETIAQKDVELEQEKKRAEQEKERAEQEKERALEQEKRAEEAERKLAELMKQMGKS